MLQRAKRKDPRRVAAGHKGAARRQEREDFAAQNIDPELLSIWDKVKRRREFQPRNLGRRSAAEAFAEYVEENRDEIDAMRNEMHDAAMGEIESFQKRCTEAAEKLQAQLEREDYATLITLEPLVVQQLNECERVTSDPAWNALEIERALRIERDGAPF